MIRKFTLALTLCCILISCGKKGDPEYKESTIKKNVAKIATIIKTIEVVVIVSLRVGQTILEAS